MTTLSSKLVRSLLPILLMTIILANAGCRQPTNRKPKVNAETNASGSSGSITPAPGGTNWVPGINKPPSNLTFNGPLFRIINNHRTSLGLSKLSWHDGLEAVAEAHSKDMYENSYLSVVSPKGESVYQKLVGAKPPISFTNAYAVVANTHGNTPRQVFNSMYKKPAVQAMIDNPSFTHIGGIAYGNTSSGSNLKETLILGQNVLP